MVARRVLICAAVLLFAPFARAGQDGGTAPVAWTGIVMNSTCDVDKAFAGLPECTQKNLPGATLVLYDDNVRHVYQLDPQAPVLGMEGESVTIHGTLDADTIHVASLQVVTSFGLNTGAKAPDFSAPDQFGHQQTLETLKRQKGTVLLFFRSADW
jgi:hypothetical protein